MMIYTNKGYCEKIVPQSLGLTIYKRPRCIGYTNFSEKQKVVCTIQYGLEYRIVLVIRMMKTFVFVKNPNGENE